MWVFIWLLWLHMNSFFSIFHFFFSSPSKFCLKSACFVLSFFQLAVEFLFILKIFATNYSTCSNAKSFRTNIWPRKKFRLFLNQVETSWSWRMWLIRWWKRTSQQMPPTRPRVHSSLFWTRSREEKRERRAKKCHHQTSGLFISYDPQYINKTPPKSQNFTQNPKFHPKHKTPPKTQNSIQNPKFHPKPKIPLKTQNSTQNSKFHPKLKIPHKTQNSRADEGGFFCRGVKCGGMRWDGVDWFRLQYIQWSVFKGGR